MKKRKILLQVLTGIIAFLILLELVLRIVNPSSISVGYEDLNGSSAKLIADDPTMGWNYYGHEYEIELVTNAFGFRDTDTSGEILFTGDSFTMGCCVAQNESYAELTGTLLNKTVLNLGMEGYGTDQAFWSYQYFGNSSKTVVYAFYINDLTDNLNSFSKPAYTIKNNSLEKINFPFQKSFISSAKATLYQYSYAFRVFNLVIESQPLLKGFLSAFTRLRFSEAFAQFSKPAASLPAEVKGFLQPAPEEVRQQLALMEKILLAYAGEVKRNNATFLLVLIPTKLQANFNGLKDKAEKAYDVTLHPEPLYSEIEAFAERNGIPALNLYPAIRESVKKGGRPYFTDDGHFTADGHRLAAEAIAKKIAAP
ncbi:hypothetical protein HZC09_00800 [Candidatus Micrarchaeota archaeon]|nr:hypothetical protein [Candidatus Micrarchaeota archaeon]